MAPPSDASPQVLVIVPARNEEANLERCLRSLVVQKGIPFAVFVVNDSSTDRTQAIAESFTRVRQCPFIGLNQDLVDVQVLAAPAELPTGTNGKVQAMIAGEQFARAAFPEAKWLLFTDADTEHLEGSLAAAVAEATEAKADLLSYSPEQLLTGIRQQLVMPVLFGELAFDYSPRRVSDPELPDAAANGQYLLVRAKSLPQVGGLAAVSHELLEDVALARLYKSKGKRILFRLGSGLVRTRMYNSWDDLRLGWTKNLALLFPEARALAARRRAEFYRLILSAGFALFWSLLVAVRGVTTVDWLVFVALGVLWFYAFTNFALFYLRISRAHFSVLSTFLSPLGLPLFSGLLTRSAKAHEQGSVHWRGRDYSTDNAVGDEAVGDASAGATNAASIAVAAKDEVGASNPKQGK
jgi:glycosyltransferase involved in cell wall biosynthesis